MNPRETITAISSGVGQAARMIVRASGPGAISIAEGLGLPLNKAGGSASRCKIGFRGLTISAFVLILRTPHSYTGDDLVEFHVSGNPVLARMLLDEILNRGARPAEPGEFTARAYFNGRIDLTEAEGVAATISAGNDQELLAARRLLGGELARQLTPIMSLLTDTLALIEVGIDFSGEDVTFLSNEQELARIGEADAALEALLTNSARFERLVHEPTIVLIGRPNAGKSTLLNALSGKERAVVSSVAGTTRDALSVEVALSRGIVRMMDVAGLDDQIAESDIDRQMHDQALRVAQTADVLILVEDVLSDLGRRVSVGREPDLVVRSKCDLAANTSLATPPDQFAVSAHTGAGMDELRRGLDDLCFGESNTGNTLALNLRHVRAIEDARIALARAKNVNAPELIAMELREALELLGGILGRITPDDLLGRIFSGFCIGK
ncbi:MAG TPA: tRNA modification GTPase [Tepidisphaeraceae bacterium]